jgi:hypothetical protein
VAVLGFARAPSGAPWRGERRGTVGEELGVGAGSGARGEHDTGDDSGGFKILVALWGRNERAEGANEFWRGAVAYIGTE